MYKSPITIIHVDNDVVAFSIDNDTYYIDLYLMIIYDAECNRLIVPNIEWWLLSHTDNSVSLATLKHMMSAFTDGASCSHEVTRDMVRAVRKMIFETSLAKEYGNRYRIELSNKLLDYGKSIANNLDKLVVNIGKEKLHAKLCRCYAACVGDDNARSIFARLISKLGGIPEEPRYPNTDDLDNIVVSLLRHECDAAMHGVLDNINSIISMRIVSDGSRIPNSNWRK